MKKIKFIFVLFVSLNGLLCFGEKVKILEKDYESLQARIDLIRSSRQEILMSYYIFEDDHVGHLVVAELLKARARGVTVKIIIDATNNHLAKDIIYTMVSSGIDVHIYNKFKILHPIRFIRYRMHDKILLVDNKSVIMGGRNIEDKYYGLADKNFTDMDVYIEGQFVSKVRDYFLDIFKANVVADVFGEHDLNDQFNNLTQTASKKLYGAEVFFYNLGTLRMDKISDWRTGFFEVSDIEFLYDNFKYKYKYGDPTAIKILDLIRAAEDSIFIESPYLVATEELFDAFTEARKRGVYIRILTNSLYSTDGEIAQAAYLDERKDFVKLGIDLYEYYNGSSFHSKSMIIGNTAIMGSMNLDVRSFYLNKETIAVFRDKFLVDELRKNMDANMKFGVKIKSNGRPAYKPNHVGIVKYLKTQFLKYFLIYRFKHLV